MSNPPENVIEEERGAVPDPAQTGESPQSPPPEVKIQFIKELLIFLSGLVLGFFWYLYFDTVQTRQREVHIIITLLVVIMAMSRYIMLTKRI